MNLFEMFDNDKKLTFMDAVSDFLPLAVNYLKITHIPKIKFNNNIQRDQQASFGIYDGDTEELSLVIHNRQPVDILRTLAHELVHAKQRELNMIKPGAGDTGSPIENDANATAGIIMRMFAKEYPDYLRLPAVTVPNQLEERRKSKKKSKHKYGGYYGYFYGGGVSGSDTGGGGGGESIKEGLGKSALVGVLAAALSMVSAPSHAEPSDAAKALGIYRTIDRYKDYNSAALEGEANQELMNILRTIQGHPNQSKLLPIIKRIINSDDTEELPPKGANNPTGSAKALIEKKYGGYKQFQEEIKTAAMSIQGSGWVYMSRSGDIKIIKNHQVRKDIALLIDWWEHAWALDYQADKVKYLTNIWKIINWDVVNQRL